MDTPQSLLHQIHTSQILEINIQHLPTKTARLEKIRLARQQLRLIKKRLRRSQDYIRSQWDGRNSGEKIKEREYLTPYELIENIILELELKLRELESDPSTEIPNYGDTIYGDLTMEFWRIGTKLDAQIWDLESQASQLKAQAKNERQSIQIETEAINFEIDMFRIKLNEMRSEVKSKKRLLTGIIALILSVPASGILLVLIVTSIPELTEFSLYVIVGCLVIPGLGIEEIYSWIRRRRQLTRMIPEAEGDIRELEVELKVLKQDYNRTINELRNRHYAINAQIQILKESASD